MADSNTQGKPPEHIHIEETKKTNWLPWLLLLLGLLALIWWLVNRSRDDAAVTTTTTTTAAAPANLPADAAVTGAAAAGVSGLGSYLAGTEAAPRTFVFERVNFDTASAALRPQDQDEVNAVAATLKQYPNSRVRLLGYADARGGAQPNAQLGQQRADAVRAALVGQGIDEGRIETASGGESDPVATNATAGGQAENRRTELIVLTR